MEIYMDNDVIFCEIKINKSVIQQIIKEEINKLKSDIANISVNSNVVNDGDKSLTGAIRYTSKIENKEIDSDNDSIRYLINNLVNKNSQFFDRGDENMSIKDFIVKIVDKLVKLTNSFREEIKDSENKIIELNNMIKGSNSELHEIKKELDDKSIKLEEAEEIIRKLKKDNSILSEHNKALEVELNSTCKDVKKIFNALQQIDPKYRTELEPYIRLHKLEPFIVSSAINIDALDKIWRVAKLAAKNNEPETSEIIRKYFEYMVKLFNEAKNEKVVTIDEVNEGDFYNIYDFECIDPDKSYGGVINKVYLPGFINNYNHKRIEKSLVDIKEK